MTQAQITVAVVRPRFGTGELAADLTPSALLLPRRHARFVALTEWATLPDASVSIRPCSARCPNR
jgi:hypothetical protein